MVVIYLYPLRTLLHIKLKQASTWLSFPKCKIPVSRLITNDFQILWALLFLLVLSPKLVTDTSFWCLVVQGWVYSCLSVCVCRGRMTYVHLAGMKRVISYKMEFSGKSKVGVQVLLKWSESRETQVVWNFVEVRRWGLGEFCAVYTPI